jgi:hypothetical protein
MTPLSAIFPAERFPIRLAILKSRPTLSVAGT